MCWIKKHLSNILLLSFLPITALAGADYNYHGTLNIIPGTGHIRANWQITVLDDTENNITFFLRNTLGEVEVEGASIKRFDISQGEEVEGLETAPFRKLQFELAEQPSPRVIHISYAGVLLPEPMHNLINAIEPGRIELNVDSFWFPIDARFNKLLTADLTVIVDGEWQGVTTGEVEIIEDGVHILNTDPRQDIAMTLSQSFRISEADGFTVYDQRDNSKGLQKLMEAARVCKQYLDRQFGTVKPLPRGKLLITKRSSSGYARQNYVVFTDISSAETGPLTRFVCHEFAHYWSIGADFTTVENWLNEAFAEYIGVMAVREHLGEEAYLQMLQSFRDNITAKDLPPVWVSGDTKRGPYLVQYRKAPLLLAELETRIGRDRFMQYTQAWLLQPVRTTPALLELLEQITDKDERDWFEQALGSSETLQ
ncbi:MAG: hypothetical protein GKR93_19605 [Gammaproteobacteria bacterium]|nr:hypothetical protein [Gammaproteobacteria bacterium]